MIAILSAILGFAAPSCDTPPELLASGFEDDVHGDAWAAELDPSTHVPSYDCTEREDTGYSAGTPFTIRVVTVDDDPVERQTANAFWVMREAAARDGVDIHINSGFRTMSEQEYFWMCYQCCCCNSCNQAASPGYSNHQSGHALDLSTSNPGVYDWLRAHGGEYGFTETVPGEPWHWEWWGGGPGGGICGLTSPPQGVVDAATCEAITGWAHDPDDPAAHVEVRVVFDGALGDPAAIAVPVMADDEREDLCEPLGSCDHAYTVEIPLGLRDDLPHAVRVFSVGEDGDSTELAEPTSVQCSPPVLDGVRRRLPTAEAFAEWRFSTVFDVAHVDEAEVLALDEGAELGPEPRLVTDAAESEIWLLDLEVRRPIGDYEVVAAWHFELGDPMVLDADELANFPVGMPLRERPIVVHADGEAWLIDDPQREEGEGSSSDGGSASGGNGSGNGSGNDDAGGSEGDTDGDALPSDASDEAGCACTSRPSGGGGLWPMLLLLLPFRRRDPEEGPGRKVSRSAKLTYGREGRIRRGHSPAEGPGRRRDPDGRSQDPPS